MYNLKLFLFGFLFLAAISVQAQHSKIYHKDWIDFNKNGKKDVYEDPSQDIQDRIDDLVNQMNLKEKTAQMATLYGFGRVLDDELPQPYWKDTLWADGIGNIDEHLNGLAYNPQAATEYSYPHSKHAKAINKVQQFFVEETRMGVPVDFTDEGIRGLTHDRATGFPSQVGVASSWDTSLVRQIGMVTGSEARALGYTNIYSPIMDVARDPRWGRVVETYGEDPYLVSQLGKNMVQSLQNQGVVSTMKHFAVYSSPKGGRDATTRTDPHVTRRAMETIFLASFKVGVEEGGAMGVMSSYNDYNGVPITGSHEFLTDILRKEFGFNGYVVSDSYAVKDIHTKHQVADTYKEAVRQSVMAGLNICTNFDPPSKFVDPLRELVKEGEIPMETINDRVADILRVKFKLGLFDQPYVENPKRADKIVSNKAHQAISLKAARESIILLKNDDSFLPLDKNDIKSVLVTGPLAKDTSNAVSRYGPSNINPVTTLQGLKNKLEPKGIKVRFSKGSDLVDDHYPDSDILDFPLSEKAEQKINDAKTAAEQSDVAIVVVGESELITGESRTRASLNLPGNQLDLVKAIHKTGTPVAVVLINGRALSINWVQQNIPAVLETWFPGQNGGTAIADVLFGDYNPGGKLPVTVPKTVGQIPFNFPHIKGSQGSVSANYSAVQPHVNDALYPFGYGLSYTSFSYDNLELSSKEIGPADSIKVTFDVTNTGDRLGDVVPQLYITDKYSSVVAYAQVLRDFDRITLDAGEKKQVSFMILPDKLTLLDKDMNWTVEPGEFEVKIGNSSKDIRLSDTLAVKEYKGK